MGKRFLGWGSTLLVIWAGQVVHAFADSDIVTNDTDLSPPGLQVLAPVPIQLSPDSVDVQPDSSASLNLQVLREDHGKLTPVTGLKMTAPSWPKASAQTDQDGIASFGTLTGCTKTVQLMVSLNAEKFEVTNGDQSYRIQADVPCTGKVKWVFRSDSNGGQALGIWQVAYRGQEKLRAAVGLNFLDRPLSFVWPADGDYYVAGTVNLTRGDHWDVVGHEMGHGIYYAAGLGRSAGGQHKIDECYSATLALSEGWASYFSGWVNLELTDPDAKFEYMVPRRAPIRFETIPDDVCKGERNEWRVTGFFWDLADLHEDGESCQEPFAKIWNPMLGKYPSTTSDARELLRKAGVKPELLQIAWDLNFKDNK